MKLLKQTIRKLSQHYFPTTRQVDNTVLTPIQISKEHLPQMLAFLCKILRDNITQINKKGEKGGWSLVSDTYACISLKNKYYTFFHKCRSIYILTYTRKEGTQNNKSACAIMIPNYMLTRKHVDSFWLTLKDHTCSHKAGQSKL